MSVSSSAAAAASGPITEDDDLKWVKDEFGGPDEPLCKLARLLRCVCERRGDDEATFVHGGNPATAGTRSRGGGFPLATLEELCACDDCMNTTTAADADVGSGAAQQPLLLSEQRPPWPEVARSEQRKYEFAIQAATTEGSGGDSGVNCSTIPWEWATSWAAFQQRSTGGWSKGRRSVTARGADCMSDGGQKLCLLSNDRFSVTLQGSKDKPIEKKKKQAKYTSIVYFFRLDVHRGKFRGLLVISPTVREYLPSLYIYSALPSPLPNSRKTPNSPTSPRACDCLLIEVLAFDVVKGKTGVRSRGGGRKLVPCDEQSMVWHPQPQSPHLQPQPHSQPQQHPHLHPSQPHPQPQQLPPHSQSPTHSQSHLQMDATAALVRMPSSAAVPHASENVNARKQVVEAHDTVTALMSADSTIVPPSLSDKKEPEHAAEYAYRHASPTPSSSHAFSSSSSSMPSQTMTCSFISQEVVGSLALASTSTSSSAMSAQTSAPVLYATPNLDRQGLAASEGFSLQRDSMHATPTLGDYHTLMRAFQELHAKCSRLEAVLKQCPHCHVKAARHPDDEHKFPAGESSTPQNQPSALHHLPSLSASVSGDAAIHRFDSPSHMPASASAEKVSQHSQLPKDEEKSDTRSGTDTLASPPVNPFASLRSTGGGVSATSLSDVDDVVSDMTFAGLGPVIDGLVLAEAPLSCDAESFASFKVSQEASSGMGGTNAFSGTQPQLQAYLHNAAPPSDSRYPTDCLFPSHAPGVDVLPSEDAIILEDPVLADLTSREMQNVNLPLNLSASTDFDVAREEPKSSEGSPRTSSGGSERRVSMHDDDRDDNALVLDPGPLGERLSDPLYEEVDGPPLYDANTSGVRSDGVPLSMHPSRVRFRDQFQSTESADDGCDDDDAAMRVRADDGVAYGRRTKRHRSKAKPKAGQAADAEDDEDVEDNENYEDDEGISYAVLSMLRHEERPMRSRELIVWLGLVGFPGVSRERLKRAFRRFLAPHLEETKDSRGKLAWFWKAREEGYVRPHPIVLQSNDAASQETPSSPPTDPRKGAKGSRNPVDKNASGSVKLNLPSDTGSQQVRSKLKGSSIEEHRQHNADTAVSLPTSLQGNFGGTSIDKLASSLGSMTLVDDADPQQEVNGSSITSGEAPVALSIDDQSVPRGAEQSKLRTDEQSGSQSDGHSGLCENDQSAACGDEQSGQRIDDDGMQSGVHRNVQSGLRSDDQSESRTDDASSSNDDKQLAAHDDEQSDRHTGEQSATRGDDQSAACGDHQAAPCGDEQSAACVGVQLGPYMDDQSAPCGDELSELRTCDTSGTQDDEQSGRHTDQPSATRGNDQSAVRGDDQSDSRSEHPAPHTGDQLVARGDDRSDYRSKKYLAAIMTQFDAGAPPPFESDSAEDDNQDDDNGDDEDDSGVESELETIDEGILALLRAERRPMTLREIVKGLVNAGHLNVSKQVVNQLLHISGLVIPDKDDKHKTAWRLRKESKVPPHGWGPGGIEVHCRRDPTHVMRRYNRGRSPYPRSSCGGVFCGADRCKSGGISLVLMGLYHCDRCQFDLCLNCSSEAPQVDGADSGAYIPHPSIKAIQIFPLRCPHCGEIEDESTVRDHFDSCEEAPVACAKCRAEHKRRLVAEHEAQCQINVRDESGEYIKNNVAELVFQRIRATVLRELGGGGGLECERECEWSDALECEYRELVESELVGRTLDAPYNINNPYQSPNGYTVTQVRWDMNVDFPSGAIEQTYAQQMKFDHSLTLTRFDGDALLECSRRDIRGRKRGGLLLCPQAMRFPKSGGVL